MASQHRARRVIYLDLTHLGRHVTGIERIAIELFQKPSFAGADVRPIYARGLISLIVKQQLLLPLLALLNPGALFVFPGFPPSPLMSFWRERVILYVHDLFLIERRQDLALKARVYMAWPFAHAVRRLKHFLTNSEKTAAGLRIYAATDAGIDLYRPPASNVFGLAPGNRAQREHARRLEIVMMGTVEPRKNYGYALNILDALRRRGFPDARLHIIGRSGWGDAAAQIANHPDVIVHGYLDSDAVRRVIDQADLYLCTSHDEGLGLPLLEAQFAGLPVIAPDMPVFREVLGQSGVFIRHGDAEAAASLILLLLRTHGWRARFVAAAAENISRWNEAASADARQVQMMLVAHDMESVETDALATRT